MMPLAKYGFLLCLAALAAAGCSTETPGQPSGSDATEAAAASTAPTAPVQAPSVPGAVTAEPEAATEAAISAKADALPADVTAFMARRDSCDHFRGEEAYDQDRKAFLDRKLEETCKGTDAALKGIRRKYRDNPGVISALWDYDDVVE